MSIISSIIDYQVENLNQDINTINNPFSSKLLIKVCIEFLLKRNNDVEARICLRCLTSLAKVKDFSSFFFFLMKYLSRYFNF